MYTIEEFNKPSPPQAGFVYLMADHRRRYKIGHSVNPRHRRAQLSRTNRPVRIVALIWTDDMIALEVALQKEFMARRVIGEWYRLNRHDVGSIMKRYGGRYYKPGADPRVP